ncbi:hypothetical protein N431DRAFT_430421 [Stipitochalara longipes BDJ]|nr:hypothetical protein N431DRAFT_430421 [Stipitochalara longipes BDJ]
MTSNAKKDFYLLHPLHSLIVDDPLSWLARIVQNYTELRAGYATPSSTILASLTIGKKEPFSNVGTVVSSLRTDSMKAAFLDFLGLSVEQYASQKESFKTQTVYRWRIHHDQKALDIVLADPAVQAELKGWKGGITDPYWFVVGLLSTTTAAKYKVERKDEGKLKANVDFGAIASAAATGSVIPPPGAQANIEVADEQSQEGKFVATADALGEGEGERIFAVEFRSFRWRTRRVLKPRVGHGPQGDGAFGDGKEKRDSEKGEAEERMSAVLDADAFDEVAEVEGDDRYFVIELGNQLH